MLLLLQVDGVPKPPIQFLQSNQLSQQLVHVAYKLMSADAFSELIQLSVGHLLQGSHDLLCMGELLAHGVDLTLHAICDCSAALLRSGEAYVRSRKNGS